MITNVASSISSSSSCSSPLTPPTLRNKQKDHHRLPVSWLISNSLPVRPDGGIPKFFGGLRCYNSSFPEKTSHHTFHRDKKIFPPDNNPAAAAASRQDQLLRSSHGRRTILFLSLALSPSVPPEADRSLCDRNRLFASLAASCLVPSVRLRRTKPHAHTHTLS